MNRRTLFASLATVASCAVAVPAAHATVTPVTPQGDVNGKHCGEPVGGALRGGTPANAVTTDESERHSATKRGTDVQTTCIGTVPAPARVKNVVAIQTGTCLQYSPLASAGTFVKGSNTLLVIGNPFSASGASYAGTCRSTIQAG